MLRGLLGRSLLLAALVLSGPVFAADWQLSHEGRARGDVTTWVREVPDSSVKAFRGVVEVDAGLVPVLAVITAVDTFPQWIYQMQGAKRLPAHGGKETLYMRFNGIWPVSDRDVVLKNTFSQDPASHAITLHSVDVGGIMGDRDGYVRIPDLDNRFVLTPLNDGWTRVEFRTFVDPGGIVPVWLANLVATKAPRDTLEGLKEQLNKPRFANATEQDLPAIPALHDLTF